MTEPLKQSLKECLKESTGLAWPKTWQGAYLFVISSLVIWIALLIALTEYGA